MWTHRLLSSKEWFFSFRFKWTADLTWGVTLLCCAIRLWRGCFARQCTNVCSPGCIEQHKVHYFMPPCFVLRMDKFLPLCVGRFEVNQYMIFIEDPPEFLRRDIRNEDSLCWKEVVGTNVVCILYLGESIDTWAWVLCVFVSLERTCVILRKWTYRVSSWGKWNGLHGVMGDLLRNRREKKIQKQWKVVFFLLHNPDVCLWQLGCD